MRKRVFWPAFIGCFLLSQFALAQSLPVASTAQRMAARPAPPPVEMVAAYAKLPMSFEPNQGQLDNRVKFLSRGRGYMLFLTAEGAVLALKSRQKDGASAIRVRLVGANSRPKIAGVSELPGKSNYFVGNDPKRWRAGVPSFERVEYSGIYPRIDLIFHGTHENLEYDFLLAPGADSKVIQLRIDGAQSAIIDDGGDLVLHAASGEVRLDRPNAYQEVNGERHSVDARYELAGSHQVRFKIASYDRTKPLVIDPVLAYSTYLGGTGVDIAQGIAVDSSGSIYLVGHTTSADFPLVSPFQPNIKGTVDLFATKLNPTGSALVYSTYLGGSSTEDAGGVALDALGNAYLTGSTASIDFPVTPGAFQTTTQSTSGTAFVTKLNSSGSALVYSTYLGGTGGDAGAGIALDSSGNAYVAGSTNSADFPTANAVQPAYGGGGDAFVSKLNSTGSGLVYSTYIGGQRNDSGLGVALDSSGDAYVVGNTTSLDFPTANALQPECALLNGSCNDAFVLKLNADGSAFGYSTYLGGGTPGTGNGATDSAKGIAVDSAGSAYILGETTALDFPTVTPLQANCAVNNFGNCADIFIAKFNSAGSALVYSTYLGGTAGENAAVGAGIAVDATGNAYVTGMTGSVDFPTSNALQPQSGGGADAFVAALNASGTGLIYCSYLGGSGTDDSRALTLDAAGNVYITGTTDSPNFPLANALQSANMGGGGDAFITKISGIAGQPGISVSPSQITFPPTLVNTTSTPVTVTVSNPGTATLLISDISSQDPFKMQNFSSNITTGIAPQASGTFDVVFSPTGAGPYSGTVSVTSNAPSSPTTILLQGTVITTGTVTVTTNNPNATFTLTGPITLSGSGTSATFNNVPIGDYTIMFGPISGFTTPLSQTQTLVAGGLIGFTGTYATSVVLLFTSDVHGLWNAQLEGGSTLLQTAQSSAAAERAKNPTGVLLLDAGDIVYGAGETTSDYSQYLQSLRSAGYDAVTVGNHDCCGGNGNYGGSGWTSPKTLTTAVSSAQALGLHVLSANINSLRQNSSQTNKAWGQYEKQLEPSFSTKLNGLNVGVFGLTAPLNYGSTSPIYDATTPFSTMLSQPSMEQTAASQVASLRTGVDILIALTHIDFQGSIFQPAVTGCFELTQPPLDLSVDVNLCGHDHNLERFEVTQNRGDGKPSYALEAGSTQTCVSPNPFLNWKDCTTLIPRPRLGRLELAVSQASVTVVSATFTDLGPMYHATFADPQSPSKTLSMTRGETQTFTATFKNLGTRTWYNSTANPDNTRIRLGILDPLFATPDYSKEPFLYDSGNPLRPATLLDSSVLPGSMGTFVFQLTVPKKTTPKKTYTLRVAPVAENSNGTNIWMNRGDSVFWFVTVN